MPDTVGVDLSDIEAVGTDGAKKLDSSQMLSDLGHEGTGTRAAEPHQLGHPELGLHFEKLAQPRSSLRGQL